MKNPAVDCRIEDIRSGLWSQDKLVNAVRNSGAPYAKNFDRTILSKAENGHVILIREHVEAIAEVLGCKPFDIYPDLY